MAEEAVGYIFIIVANPFVDVTWNVACAAVTAVYAFEILPAGVFWVEEIKIHKDKF